MTTARVFNKTTLFAVVLALLAWFQIYVAATFVVLNVPHGMPLSMILLRHSNLYPLLLLAAALWIFKRNGIALPCLLAVLILPLFDTLFSAGHYLDGQLIVDTVIHVILVWYGVVLIRSGEITDPRQSGSVSGAATLIVVGSLLQMLYVAYFLLWPGPDGRNFVSMATLLPAIRWHLVCIAVASLVMILAAFSLKNKKRNWAVLMVGAALLAMAAQFFYYSYPALVTTFLAIVFWRFGTDRRAPVELSGSGTPNVGANSADPTAVSVRKIQVRLPRKLIPALLMLPAIVVIIFAHEHRVHGVPVATGEMPATIVMLSGLLFAVVQAGLSIGLYADRNSRLTAVLIGLLIALICTFTFMADAVCFIDASLAHKFAMETVTVERLETVIQNNGPSRFYIVLSAPAARLKTGRQANLPSVEISHIQLAYLNVLGVTQGSRLELMETAGPLGLPYAIYIEPASR